MDAGPAVWSVSFEPIQLVPVLLVGLAYARRARTLARRGTPVPSWRLWCFAAGLALLVVSLASPLAAFAEEQFFSAHMLQHVLLGDLAPLALVAGLTGPILRPVLSLGFVERLRVLAHPLVALPLWGLNLYLWHLGVFYEAALRHESVHALEHLSFLVTGALMWTALLEVLPGPAWFGTGAKLGYIVAVRLLGTVLANVFVWSDQVFYGLYRHPDERWGISAHGDQVIAGGLLMIEGSLVTLAAFAWLFLRLGAESELRQRLLEQGLDPGSVSRAVRYGRGEELAGRR